MVNEKIEKAIQGIEKWKDIGINSTFGWAYKESKYRENNIIDLCESIDIREIEFIIQDCKKYDIKEIAISSGFSGLAKVVARFIELGCELDGMVEVNGYYSSVLDKAEIIPAFKLIIK